MPSPTSTSCWPYEPPAQVRCPAGSGWCRSTRCSTSGSRRAARARRRAAGPVTPGRSREPRSTTPAGFWRLMSVLGSECCGSTGLGLNESRRCSPAWEALAWPPAPSTTPGTTSTRRAATPYAGSGSGPTLCRTPCCLRLARRRSARPLTVEQARRILFDAIPDDRNPAMWLTGLMCGLRPGELAGLRWPFVDIDSEEPAIEVAERAQEVSQKYVGQASPKTKKSRRRIGLHPLLVAALQRHRHDMQMLGLCDPGSFVFCTRNGTPFLLRNMRRDFGRLCTRAGLGSDWTTYELRHSFVSLVADQLDDLVKVADLAGHRDPRTTQGYRHPVRSSLPHAIEAWDALLAKHATAS